MNAREKYKALFGSIESLAQPISWSTGVSNMLDWLTWSTNDVLGVTKTRYRKMIVEWSHDPEVRNATLEEKQLYVATRLKHEIAKSERYHRYDMPSSSIASPQEALRRAKYFSEDYLNKEFDIFWGLVSDRYLDSFYGQFTRLQQCGTWASHGNGGLFGCSTGIREMQMDNLSYNVQERILVANELKLGGRKNPDQILKYALMYRFLMEREFVDPESRFLVMFIGDRVEDYDWEALIDQEIEYCRRIDKSTSRLALNTEVIELARGAEYAGTTWRELLEFNERHMSELDPVQQQVEWKLHWGFNETLSAKAFMQAR